MADSSKLDYIQERLDQVADTVSNIDKDTALQKVALEHHTKQDEEMYVELRRMNDILQQNTESLKEHMGNNILLKDLIETLNKRLDPIELAFIQKKAVKSWMMSKIKFYGILGTTIVAVAGAWVYIKPIIEHLFK